MSGVADPQRTGTAYQTASSDANEHLGKQLDTLEFCENLLGEESFGIHGGYEESQAKSLQDCATGQTRYEPATATSKSASKTLSTHTADIMQENGIESEQFVTQADVANGNAGDIAQHRPLAEGSVAVQPSQSDGIGLFDISAPVPDVDAPTSENGKYFDSNINATERCSVPNTTLPDVTPSAAGDGVSHPTSAEPFHAEHGTLHTLDMPIQPESRPGTLASQDAENAHPLVVNEMPWHDWRLNEGTPLSDTLVQDPLSTFSPWGEASSTDTGSEGGKEEGERDQTEVDGQQQEDGRDKGDGEPGDGDAGDGEGAVRPGKNNTKPIVQVCFMP